VTRPPPSTFGSFLISASLASVFGKRRLRDARQRSFVHLDRSLLLQFGQELLQSGLSGNGLTLHLPLAHPRRGFRGEFTGGDADK